MEERAIFIFDSLNGHIRQAALEAYFLPLHVVIPLIIKSHVTDESKYSTENFKFMNMKDVPQQMNGFDCGIFANKYVEFLQVNMDVNTIRPDYVLVWRKKLTTELLAWDFEP
ncbi:sentrin-specific protease 1-like [Olea europaea var. sylvestris]|uniref:sentrin-specific protease 1-like n=1 Tax=Olea europaea var. sylvestris TaxID=158386 RepID=UPI000C1CFD1C|nr:sentrin-specific protease 1-like [Olea europaea var. sylvestris]